MEIIEITGDNISKYMAECIELQQYLVSSGTQITEELFIGTAEDDHSYFLGVVNDKQLVGVGVLSKIVHPVNITGYVNNVVVSPETRGKGLFTLIMDDMEKKAREWGCTDMALTCSREKVQGMYEKRGYVHKKTNFYILKLK